MFLDRLKRWIAFHVRGLAWSPDLMEQTAQTIAQEIVLNVWDPSKDFWERNVYLAIERLCMTAFTRALRIARRGRWRNAQARSQGRRVPFDLCDSLDAPRASADDGGDPRDNVVDPQDEIGATEANLEAERWIASLPDELDRALVRLRALGGFHWHEIIARIYDRDPSVNLDTPDKRAEAAKHLRARYAAARRQLRTFLRDHVSTSGVW